MSARTTYLVRLGWIAPVLLADVMGACQSKVTVGAGPADAQAAATGSTRAAFVVYTLIQATG